MLFYQRQDTVEGTGYFALDREDPDKKEQMPPAHETAAQSDEDDDDDDEEDLNDNEQEEEVGLNRDVTMNAN